jgi:serine/threonine protein kinase
VVATNDEDKGRILRAKAHLYHIVKRLGAGGMGETYVAYDHNLGPLKKFVIKILQVRLANDPEARESFVHEARAMAALDHERIVSVLWLDELEDGRPLYAMKLVSGESLYQRLVRRTRLPVYESILIAIDVLNGLHHAHKHGVVHQDVKPSNVMIAFDSRGMLHATLIDFGIMRLADDVGSGFAGTLAYAAPEQMTGRGEVGRRTDLFAVGGVLYEMLSGRRPFSAFAAGIAGARERMDKRPPSLARLAPFPEELVQLVDAALSPDPDDRPATAKKMADVLEKIAREIEEPAPVRRNDSGVADPITRAALANLTDPEGPDYAELLSRASAGLAEPETVGNSVTGPLLGVQAAYATALDTQRDPPRRSVTEPLARPRPQPPPPSQVITDPVPLAVVSGTAIAPSYVDTFALMRSEARPIAHAPPPPIAPSPPAPPAASATNDRARRVAGNPHAEAPQTRHDDRLERQARASLPVVGPRRTSRLEIRLRRLLQSYSLQVLVRFFVVLLVVLGVGLVMVRVELGVWPWSPPAGHAGRGSR